MTAISRKLCTYSTYNTSLSSPYQIIIKYHLTPTITLFESHESRRHVIFNFVFRHVYTQENFLLQLRGYAKSEVFIIICGFFVFITSPNMRRREKCKNIRNTPCLAFQFFFYLSGILQVFYFLLNTFHFEQLLFKFTCQSSVFVVY